MALSSLSLSMINDSISFLFHIHSSASSVDRAAGSYGRPGRRGQFRVPGFRRPRSGAPLASIIRQLGTSCSTIKQRRQSIHFQGTRHTRPVFFFK